MIVQASAVGGQIRALRTPSGRFIAIPGRRGKRAGVSITFDIRCRWRLPGGRIGRHGADLANCDSDDFRGLLGRAPRRSGSRRPRQTTSVPPMRRSGAAYSTTTSSGASARAVTRSKPMPVGHSSARALTTSTLPSSHVRTRGPGTRTCASSSRRACTLPPGSAIASGRPGRPAPDPRSAIVVAARTGSSSSATSESARWSSSAWAASHRRRRERVLDQRSAAASERLSCVEAVAPARPWIAVQRADRPARRG